MFANLNTNKFHPLTIPLKDGSKFFVYFKQFNPEKISSAPSDQSLYEILKNFKSSNNKDKTNNKASEQNNSNELDLLPTKRTLLIINLEKEFKEEKIKKLFRILGKIRKIYVGNFKNNKKIDMYFFDIIYFFDV
jgi:RNA recognition motif-containing protein